MTQHENSRTLGLSCVVASGAPALPPTAGSGNATGDPKRLRPPPHLRHTVTPRPPQPNSLELQAFGDLFLQVHHLIEQVLELQVICVDLLLCLKHRHGQSRKMKLCYLPPSKYTPQVTNAPPLTIPTRDSGFQGTQQLFLWKKRHFQGLENQTIVDIKLILLPSSTFQGQGTEQGRPAGAHRSSPLHPCASVLSAAR